MPENPETIAECKACSSPMDISAVAPFSNVVCPSCGEQSRVKTQFGPYTLTHRYAVGGMSMVFSGRDSTLDREVAVKILSENYSQDQKRIEAFEEEARITASFSHPNVVRVLRTGHAFGRYYIAMELVSGGHFEHHIRERGRIPEEDLLPTAIEVAQGLKAAKAAGLIHRDVKPGNILLDGDGHAKLVDFGLSLVTQGGTATAEELWATPFYVPPETVEGQAEDFRSDIYALGATLYHALAGVPPCNEDSMATDRLLKAKQEIIPLKQAAPDVSDETCEIVTQAMAFSPSERFSSYDDMIHALRRAEKHLRHSKHQKHLEMTQGHKLPKKKKRKPIWLGISAAAVLVILVSVVAARLNDPEPDPDDNTNPGNNGGTTNLAGNNQEEISQNFRKARSAMSEGEYGEAARLFTILHNSTMVREPSRTMAGIEAVLCSYLDGNGKQARKIAGVTRHHIEAVDEEVAPIIGRGIPDLLEQLDTRPPLKAVAGSTPSQTVIIGMLSGLKNWQQGLLDPAAEGFRMAASAKLGADDQWAAGYQKLASDFLADHTILTGPLFSSAPVNLERCERMIEELDELADSLKTKGRSRYNLRAWQLDLARHAKDLRERQN